MIRRQLGPRGEPLPADARVRVAAVVVERGEREAAQILGVAVPTLARMLAGMRVHRHTSEVVSARLEALDARRGCDA